MPVRNLDALTLLVTAMIAIDASLAPTVLLMVNVAPTFFITNIVPYARTFDTIQWSFKVAMLIVFGRWIYLAGRNLLDANVDGLKFAPSARIWWFVVPVAGLFKPFQAMRELSNGSLDILPRDRNDLVVTLWWTLLLAKIALLWASRGQGKTHSSYMMFMSATTIIDVALATVAIAMIRRIAAAQRNFGESQLGEVFA